MFILNIIGWCIFGLVVGATSRFLLPGKDPLSWWMTAALGVAGSFGFGLIFYMLFGSESGAVEPAGFIGSVVGGVLVLVIVRYQRRAQDSRISPRKYQSNS